MVPPHPTDPHRTPSPTGDLRVLVVDDNASDRWYFSEILRARSYAVLSCEDAETAWAVYQTTPTPLVILDLHLPGMDGSELCRKIKAHAEGPRTIVLAVTGSTAPDALERVLDAGADDVLAKPVDPDLLDIRLVIAEGRIRAERRQTETRAALDEKTRELETLFDNLPDVFFSIDLREERLIQISPAARDVLRRDPADLRDHPALWRRLLLGGEGAEELWAGLVGGEVEGPVLREHTVDEDGALPRHLRTNLWVERDVAGTPLRADGVIRDVTSLEEANQKLARRNRALATLNRMAEISLAGASSQDALEDMLAEVCRAIDVPMGAIEVTDAENHTLSPVAFHGLDDPEYGGGNRIRHTTLVGRSVQDGTAVASSESATIESQGPVYLADTGTRTVLSLPLHAGPDVLGALVLASPGEEEISGRQRELAVNLANALAGHVERMEAERALRDNETEYRALVAQLSQANTELEAFAYSISHDLRAPLRTMQGFAHALLQNFGEELAEEARDYARRIIASGKQSEQLIGDLLEYSRVSFEQLELKPVDLAGVVAAAREQVQADVQERGARIEVVGDLPSVLGSRTILVQVLANLLSNAVKFVPDERTPRIRVHTEELGGEIRLWVEDNGVGVPTGDVEKIFRVFERLQLDIDRPGTGIGLAIVRRGMQRIGGRAGVERVPTGGSAFWIQIPQERRRLWRPWSRRR